MAYFGRSYFGSSYFGSSYFDTGTAGGSLLPPPIDRSRRRGSVLGPRPKQATTAPRPRKAVEPEPEPIVLDAVVTAESVAILTLAGQASAACKSATTAQAPIVEPALAIVADVAIMSAGATIGTDSASLAATRESLSAWVGREATIRDVLDGLAASSPMAAIQAELALESRLEPPGL